MLLTKTQQDVYQVWIPASNKITSTRAVDFIITQASKPLASEQCKQSGDMDGTGEQERANGDQSKCVDDDEASGETRVDQSTDKDDAKDEVIGDGSGDDAKAKDINGKKKRRAVRAEIRAGQRRRPQEKIPGKVVNKKRKEIVTDIAGNIRFVMVAREMQLPRNDPWRYPNPDGGDLDEEMKAEMRPHMARALKSTIERLSKERMSAEEKRSVRTKITTPKNMAEESTLPDYKEWAAAHDAELERQKH